MNKGTFGKIAKNASYLLFSDILVKIIAFFTSIYLARYFSVENYGTYNFLIVYFTFFNIIGVFGIDTVVLRDIARSKEDLNTVMSNALSIRIITSLAAIVLSILFIQYINNSKGMQYYVLLTAIILLFQNISYLNESLFKACEKMEYYAYTIVLYKFSFAIFIFLIIVLKMNFLWLLFAFISSEFIRTLVSYMYTRRSFHYKFTFDIVYWKYLIRESLPFLVNSVLYIINYRIDVLMLSMIIGNVSVGIYSAAYKLTDPLLFIPSAINLSLFPLIARQFVSKKEAMKRTYIQSTKLIFILVLPMATGIFVLSTKLILIIFGKEYSESITVLQILIASLLFNSLTSMQSSILISTNNQKIITSSILLSCTVNIILNLLLIPNYSYIGAAIATLISVMIQFIAEEHYISKRLDIKMNFNYLKPIASVVIMGYGVFLLEPYNIILQILSGILIYFISLHLLKSLEKEDINMIKKMMNRK